MTLETLQAVQTQLVAQLDHVNKTPHEKPVIQHTNAIELHGALQLLGQLIQQEQLLLGAPPGATGPAL